MPFELRCVESMPYAENSYLLWRSGQRAALVVDPGFEPDLIFDVLAKENLTIATILNTHGHVDHIAGNAAMKEKFPTAPLLIGHGDAAMLADPMKNMSGFFGTPIVSPPADQLLREGETIEVSGFRFEILEIPGHSPGHIVYVLCDDGKTHVFGGDVLFAASIGRTDFPGGSLPQLLSGIRGKLWPLPDEAVVYPGHGPTTTIGIEKRTNPFCGANA